MTRDEQLALIRQKCIDTLTTGATRSEKSVYARHFNRPIRLADVLLGIGESDWFVNTHTGRFFKWSRALGEMVGQPYSWDLCRDDLTQQSDECIAFLADPLK
jgi:hypothetical protein